MPEDAIQVPSAQQYKLAALLCRPVYCMLNQVDALQQARQH